MKRLLAIIVLVAGCGGATVPSSSPEAVVATTTTQAPSATPSLPPIETAAPTPAPTPDPEAVRKAAGIAYLAGVKPYNKTLDALAKQYRNATRLKSLKAYCQKLADNERVWLLKVKAILVPADTTADIKALIRYAAAEEADLRSCAKARTISNWNAGWTAADKAGVKGHEAANLVRLDLGIPSVGA